MGVLGGWYIGRTMDIDWLVGVGAGGRLTGGCFGRVADWAGELLI